MNAINVTPYDLRGFVGSKALTVLATTNLDTQLSASERGRRLRFSINPGTAAATLMLEFAFDGAAVTIAATTAATFSAERLMMTLPAGATGGVQVREFTFTRDVTGFALYASTAPGLISVEVFAN